MTFLHFGTVQLTCRLAKSRCFFFMVGVRRGFRVGFLDCRSNSLFSRLETVLTLTSVPLDRKIARIFLHELVGDRMTTRRIVWSSLGVVFLGLLLRFRSVKIPSHLNFTIALCTAFFEHFNLALSVYSSSRKVRILAALFMRK